MDLVVMKPKAWLKPPRHSRTRFDDAELRHLADNIDALGGLLNPIVALPTGEIIAGHRRWKAAMLNDRITELAVRIETDPLTDREIRIRRISENLQRSDLSLYDKWLECRGFREEEPDISAKEIGKTLNVDASTITRYLCLDNCIEAVREAAKGGLGVKACYEISKEPPERQTALLADALAGGAGQVAKARQKPAGTASAARASKIKVVLPSGVVITVGGGDSLSLEEAIAELSEALSEMRKAEKQGLDPKTFMALCRDRAKAGV